MAKIKQFLKQKDIVFSLDRYLFKALAAMAQGLFASLLAGLIIKTIGQQIGLEILVTVGSLAMDLMGAAIAVAVASVLNAPPLVLFSSVICGMAGASLGGPAGAFVATIFGVEFGKLISKQTKLDIMITPMVTFGIGYVAAMFIGMPIGSFMLWLGDIIMWATELQPLLMGIVVATLMGLALTAPISSAALAIMLDLSGLAAGAATAGCAAQMIGFAVLSYRENGLGGLLAQGLGTSMLQIPNILRNPLILIPPTLAGIITGPLSITLWKMENLPTGAGMGTSGLVGQISTFLAMGNSPSVWLGVIMLHFILPAGLTLIFAQPLRLTGKIKPEHLKLDI